jgi:hypothetical protein
MMAGSIGKELDFLLHHRRDCGDGGFLKWSVRTEVARTDC